MDLTGLNFTDDYEARTNSVPVNTAYRTDDMIRVRTLMGVPIYEVTKPANITFRVTLLTIYYIRFHNKQHPQDLGVEEISGIAIPIQLFPSIPPKNVTPCFWLKSMHYLGFIGIEC